MGEAVLTDHELEQETVAKKKAAKQEPAKQKSIIVLKGNEEFGSWLKQLAGFVNLPATNAIDQALARYAKEMGFPVPMPRRQKR